MDEYIEIEREVYESLIEQEVHLRLLKRALLQDASESYDETYLVMDNLNSKQALSLLKIIEPHAYNARLEECLQTKAAKVKPKKVTGND